MALIRLQKKVPEIYINESRDFQLFCRLYDIILNGVKYDIDSVERLVNTDNCKSNALQLLQTKLGFFTNKNFTDVDLRKILKVFPILVKYKGTRFAIESAVYTFLKIIGLETKANVDIVEGKPTKAQKLLYGSNITDHCVVIGIESTIRDMTALSEMLKYIIPFGYNLFFYFFSEQDAKDTYRHSDKIELVLVSNDINSAMYGPYANDEVTELYPAEGHEDWDSEKKEYKQQIEKEMIGAPSTIDSGVSEAYKVSKDPETGKTIITRLNQLEVHDDFNEG